MRLGTAADIVGRLERLLGGTDTVASVHRGVRPPPPRDRGRSQHPCRNRRARGSNVKLQRSALVDKSGGNPGGNPRPRRRALEVGDGAADARAAGRLMTMPPGGAGTYLVHFTGSAAHNVRLRRWARERVVALRARLHDALTTRPGDPKRVTFATEAEVYDFLGLPFIDPELREDRARSRPPVPASCRPSSRATTSGRLPHPLAIGRTVTSRSSDGRRGARARPAATRSLTDHTQT